MIAGDAFERIKQSLPYAFCILLTSTFLMVRNPFAQLIQIFLQSVHVAIATELSILPTDVSQEFCTHLS